MSLNTIVALFFSSSPRLYRRKTSQHIFSTYLQHDYLHSLLSVALDDAAFADLKRRQTHRLAVVVPTAPAWKEVVPT
jgi:hypothetical protein